MVTADGKERIHAAQLDAGVEHLAGAECGGLCTGITCACYPTPPSLGTPPHPAGRGLVEQFREVAVGEAAVGRRDPVRPVDRPGADEPAS
jgi:hypothetical protein